MTRRNYKIESIVSEYEQEKRYKKMIEVQKFQKENCINCKNKKTDKCNITRDINNQLKCAFKEN